LSEDLRKIIRDYTVQLGRALNVVGLMNVQYAIHNGKVYVLEVNPRASRTVPFVSKATGVPLAKIAARLMVGRKLKEFNLPAELKVSQYCVKSPVFPFSRFQGVDTILGPEMKSTGEVMGTDDSHCDSRYGTSTAQCRCPGRDRLQGERRPASHQ
jgi:carbamoyl-phosphate synthase large subunit